jgi:hypothetical protein
MAVVEHIILDVYITSSFAAISHRNTEFAIGAALCHATSVTHILEGVALDVHGTITIV